MKKEPMSVRFMDWWSKLRPAVQMSAAYIFAGLLTMLQQVLEGSDLKSAFITFLTVLITTINGLKAVSKTADKHSVEK